MKKSILYIAVLYILFVLIHAGSGWLLRSGVMPAYSLTEVEPVDIDTLRGKKAVAVEYIDRTHDAYILTGEGGFYALNLRNHNVHYHARLEGMKGVKDMKCQELRCMAAKGDSLLYLDFFRYGSFRTAPKISTVATVKNPIADIALYGSGVLVRDDGGRIHHFNYAKRDLVERDLKRLDDLKSACGTSNLSITGHWTNEKASCRKFLKISLRQGHNTMTFSTLRGITDIVVDNDAFCSNRNGFNVLFIGSDSEVYQAKTATSFVTEIHTFTMPFAYLPLIPFMGRQ
jgi:hypothetical protein